jgi:hypothetical protein
MNSGGISLKNQQEPKTNRPNSRSSKNENKINSRDIKRRKHNPGKVGDGFLDRC